MESEHDKIIFEIQGHYDRANKMVLINPGNKKWHKFRGLWPDVLAAEPEEDGDHWVIEVETEDSVGTKATISQWLKYAEAYGDPYLVVPAHLDHVPEELAKLYPALQNCHVITWQPSGPKGDGYKFSGLPGLEGVEE